MSDRSHARARPETVDERVEHIADLMRSLQWERGKTSKKLADEWEVAVSTVENYSAEASRRVRAEVQDPGETGRDISIGLRKLFVDAVNNADGKTAARLAEVWATVSGAKAAEKLELTKREASPSEAARIIREVFGQHAAKPEGGGGSGSVPPAT
jgi:hypothetical protein